MERVSRWFKEKLIGPLNGLSFTGKVSAIFSGLWFGIFPIPGASTFLLVFAIQYLKMRNAPMNPAQATIALAINLLATPVMLALIPLWLSLGSGLFGLQGCDAADILPAFKESIIQAMQQFTGCLAAAVFAWVFATPLVMGPVFLVHRKSLENARSDRVPLIRVQ
jgi:hypothetical protein